MRSYDVVAFGEPLQAVDRAVPVPTGTEVLLKVLATGVCHSDLHLSDGGYDLGGGKTMKVSDRGVTLPLTMGHEIAGEIVALGPDAPAGATGGVRLVYPWIGCGACPACRRETENLCRAPSCIGIHRPGGYAEYVLVPHPRYLVEIEPLTPEQAAPFACSGLTAYGALKKLGPSLATAPVGIIGAGGLGLMAIALLKAMGGHSAIVADIGEDKRNAALAAGAASVIDASKPAAAVEFAAAAPDGLLAVIDFVGLPSTAALGLAALARGGHYVAVGLYGGELNFPLPLLPIRALTIQGSYTGTLDELHELMSLVRASGVTAVQAKRQPMADVNAVLGRLRAGQIAGRTVVVP